MAKLQEKTLEALNFIKAHGGDVTTVEIQEGLGLEKIASVTGRVNSLVKNELAYRKPVEVEGKDKPEMHVVLTDAGMAYNPETAE